MAGTEDECLLGDKLRAIAMTGSHSLSSSYFITKQNIRLQSLTDLHLAILTFTIMIRSVLIAFKVYFPVIIYHAVKIRKLLDESPHPILTRVKGDIGRSHAVLVQILLV